MPRLIYLFGFLLSLQMMSACSTTTESAYGNINYKKAAEVNAKMGAGYMNQGNYELAMTKLNKAIKFDDENLHANHYMGELYRRLGDMDKADEFFKRALELNKTDPQLLNNYGVFLCEIDKYQEAENYFDQVLKDHLYQGKALVYENLGLCAKYKGNLAESEKHFRRALTMNPKLAKSLLSLAQLKFDQRNKISAYSYFQQFSKISRQSPESLWLGILLEKERGNRSGMASYALRLKNQFPLSKEAELLAKLELLKRKRK
ncbi:MAG: type IV pilus biogenesis/stability protein PilW [Gammaproteobacteria bacterium]|nr:type IV pilus biogenesis/stability protein PilW [Gammaproteobacteria bacterium]